MDNPLTNENVIMNRKDTLTSIKDFVNDIHSIFGTKAGKTPLDLYHRLLQHVKDEKSDGLDNYVMGFQVFFNSHKKSLESVEDLEDIPRDVYIRYKDSGRVYLEIQKYIYKSAYEEKNIILEHLRTINASITPTESSLALLQDMTIASKLNISANSKEYQFVKNLFEKARKAVENSDASDPASVITQLMSSGALNDMANGLKGNVTKGMDLQKILEALTEYLQELMGGNNQSQSMTKEEQDLKNVVSGFVSSISSITQNINSDDFTNDGGDVEYLGENFDTL